MNRFPVLAITSAAALAVGACAPAAATPPATFTPVSPTATLTPSEAPPTATPIPTPASTPTFTPGTVDAPRVVEVVMGNFFFEPASLSVQRGETIRFVVHNPTTIEHEFLLGTAEDQEHHAQDMAGGMGHHGMADEPNRITVQPGDTGELVWTFDEMGQMLVGCHVPGHWDAGMKGAVEIVP